MELKQGVDSHLHKPRLSAPCGGALELPNQLKHVLPHADQTVYPHPMTMTRLLLFSDSGEK